MYSIDDSGQENETYGGKVDSKGKRN